MFSGFLHYVLDELDKGSIVGSIEILGLFDRFDNGSMILYCLCNISQVRGFDGFDMRSMWDR